MKRFGQWSSASALILLTGCGTLPSTEDILLVNDIHSRLNPTIINRIETPTSIPELQAILKNHEVTVPALAYRVGTYMTTHQDLAQILGVAYTLRADRSLPAGDARGPVGRSGRG